MGFVSKIWKDRKTEYPNRRLLTKEDGSKELVTVSREEGTISEEGDAFSAENMNDLETRIKNIIGTGTISSILGKNIIEAIEKLLDHITWKPLQTQGIKGAMTVPIPNGYIDINELSIKVNVNSKDIILKLHVLMYETQSSKQSFRTSYFQNKDNGSGAMFDITSSSITLTAAFLTVDGTTTNVTAETAWSVYYR